MRLCTLVIVACAAAVILAGCAEATPGSVRSMGEVEYALAFATAREVMTVQHGFSLEADGPEQGIIRSRPRPVEASNDRLFGGYPARQVAVLRLRREGNEVVAQASVAIERQRAQMRRGMRLVGDNYDTVPNKTPANDEAATTIDQNQNWEVWRYAHDKEIRILDDLYKALHPGERSP